ncbi:Sulfate transporter 4.1 [Durusdinium trenchii]|uniref:Chloroplastic (AST82) n=1 Tax=Durusdinium trenchii TaxID=1381693 RepID=A0ABP0NAL6_9DINO
MSGSEPLVRKTSGRKQSRTWWTVLQEQMPILFWLPRYPKENLSADLAGAMTLGCILIGQSLAHANLCMVDLINGPYSCMLPPMVYAIFGTCVHASVGTGGLVSLLTGEVLADQGDLAERTQKAAILTALVGIIMSIMGLLQLSFLVRFLSRPALSGFITASALLIILSQVAPMLGLPSWASKGGIVNVVKHHIKYLELLDPATTALSLVAVIFLMNAKILKKVKYLKFIGDFKELVLLALSAIFCNYYNPEVEEEFQIKVVGTMPSGLPSFVPPVQSMQDLRVAKELLPGAILVAFVVFLSSFAGAKKFAMKDGYQIRAFNELMALGFANFLGAFCGSVPTQIGLSRMGIAHQAGVRSQLGANILVGVVVCAGVVLFSRYIEHVPMCVLNAIIVNGASHLTEFDQAHELWAYATNERYNWKTRGDMLTWVIGFSCTLYFGAFQGMLSAVFASLIIILYQVVNPDIVQLGFREGDEIDAKRARKWMSVEREGALREPGILVLRLEGPLFYANVERLQEWIEEEELEIQEKEDVNGIVLSASAISFMDTTAVQTLTALAKTCADRGTLFCMANTFGQTGRIAADRLEPILESQLQEFPFLQSQVRQCSSVDDFILLIRKYREAIPQGRSQRLVRASTLQTKSIYKPNRT